MQTDLYRPASTARREEEPVHEDTRAVIVRIIGQQSVPFILLLTGTVTVTPQGGGFAANRADCYQPIGGIFLCADLLLNGLLKLLIVHDCSHFAVAITCPEWGVHFNL